MLQSFRLLQLLPQSPFMSERLACARVTKFLPTTTPVNPEKGTTHRPALSWLSLSKATALWLWLYIFNPKWFLQLSRKLVEYFKLASMVTLYCLICSLAGKPVALRWPQGTRLVFKHAVSGASTWTLSMKKQNTLSSACNWSIYTFCSLIIPESYIYNCHKNELTF